METKYIECHIKEVVEFKINDSTTYLEGYGGSLSLFLNKPPTDWLTEIKMHAGSSTSQHNMPSNNNNNYQLNVFC